MFLAARIRQTVVRSMCGSTSISGDRDQVFGRYSRIKATSISPSAFDGIADGGNYSNGDTTFNVHGVAVSYTHTFTATLITKRASA
jgi:hypothetical protein